MVTFMKFFYKYYMAVFVVMATIHEKIQLTSETRLIIFHI